MTARASNSLRFAGLELGGSKSSRTALLSLEYFPQEKRIFLGKSERQIGGGDGAYADEKLLKLLKETKAEVIGVNAPLTLTPCLSCSLPICPGFRICEVPSVRWMREESLRQGISENKQVTPYTQRPVDLKIRGEWQKRAGISLPSEESFGAGRAPLAARMQYLQRHLQASTLLEVQPRLALALLAPWFSLSARELRRYREMEDGVENRVWILEKLSAAPKFQDVPKLFLYEADIYSLAREIAVFDAFLCALMAVYSEQGLLEKGESDPAFGSIAIPKMLVNLREEKIIPKVGR